MRAKSSFAGGDAFLKNSPLVLAVALALGVTPNAATAATIYVTSASDTGTALTCTLRQAIVSMNTGSVAGTACVNHGAGFSSGDTINFDPVAFPQGGGNTITLADSASSTLHVTDPALNIDATINGQVTIQRPAAAANHFYLISQDQPSGGAMTLSHLTLKNGQGGIRETEPNANLALTNCTIDHSGAAFPHIADGVNATGAVTLINSTIRYTNGTGIESGTSLTMFNSSIFRSYYSGISAYGGVTLTGSIVAGNSSIQYGGGIYLHAGSVLAATNSTISGNFAASTGGGIFAMGSAVTLTNSTISGNAILAVGGAGIHTSPTAPAPIAVNSIIAGNTGGFDISGAWNSPGAGSSGNLIGVDPGLSSPASDNGGPTLTMLPLPGSPAIDAIPCTNAPFTDQRGVTRPQNGNCDIGSVEVSVPPLACNKADITLQSQAAVNAFQATYGPCTAVNGNLEINGSDITDLSPLSNLTQVAGSVRVQSNAVLSTISGLGGIKTATSLYVQYNTSLTTIAGLSNLKSIGFRAVIMKNAALTDIALPKLASVGEMTVYSNPALTGVSGLPALVSVTYNFRIANNPALTQIVLPPSMKTAYQVTIDANPMLVSIEGPNLVSTKGDLLITNDPALTSITLTGLIGVGAQLRIANSSLADVALPNLTTTGSDLSIESNSVLASLDGLEGFNHTGGRLKVIGNPVLTNLAGLSGAFAVGTVLEIHDNPKLGLCQGISRLIDAVDDGLPGPGPGAGGVPDVGAEVQIRTNAPGCNSPTDALLGRLFANGFEP